MIIYLMMYNLLEKKRISKFKGYRMKMFSFLQEMQMKRKYVAVQYDRKTSIALREWCLDNGFNLSVDFEGNKQGVDQFDFHTTIFFTSNRHNVANGLFDTKLNPKVIPTGFELLGEDKNIPVLKVKGEGISVLREYYEKEGFKDSWPVYKPHISLSYDRKNFPDVEKLELPDFDFTFDKIKISDAMEL